MSTGDDLLLAILRQPRDYTLRRVYADSLQEQGDGPSAAKAEFIRESIRFESLETSDPERAAIRDRLRELFRANAETGIWPEYAWLFAKARENWWAGHSSPVQVDGVIDSALGCRVRIRRGFPYWLHYPVSDFAQDAGHWFRKFPITVVNLWDRWLEPVRWDCQAGGQGAEYYPRDNEGHWTREYEENDPSSIHAAIYDLLPGGTETVPRTKEYAVGAIEAQEDLKMACVRYGRQEAGLPYGLGDCDLYA
jgi:uncharacterized protein (TIGR02996 family)